MAPDKLAHDRAEADGLQHSAQVLPFRLRPPAGERPSSGAPQHPLDDDSDGFDDLARYEEDHEEDDYRHRMLMNVIAVVVVTLLVGAGVWIADTIAEMEKDQDCVMQGRQNCAPIEIPAASNRR